MTIRQQGVALQIGVQGLACAQDGLGVCGRHFHCRQSKPASEPTGMEVALTRRMAASRW
jgi:hypothetical protein